MTATRTIRVYAKGDLYYACVRATGRRTVLVRSSEVEYGYEVGHVRISGPYVGFAYGLDEADVGSVSRVRVINARTGKRDFDRPAVGAGFYSDVHALVMDPKGNVAWIGGAWNLLEDNPPRACEPDSDESATCSYPLEVRKRSGRHSTLLDRGRRIDRKSLRLRGRTLRWSNGGVTRTARLARTGKVSAGAAWSPAGKIFTLTGAFGGIGAGSADGRVATLAEEVVPAGVTVLPDGTILIANGSDVGSPYFHTILRLDPQGRIWRVGAAFDAAPSDVAVTADGALLVAVRDLNRVFRMSMDGRTRTRVAGTGRTGSYGDGKPAVTADLFDPTAVAATPDGGYLIADSGNNKVRRVSPDGTIRRFAGTGRGGYKGDGGPATAALLDVPSSVATLPDGSVLIADTGNNVVRRVAVDGTISTVVGDGKRGARGDGGPARGARLSMPERVRALPDGGFLVIDSGNDVVRRVLPDGTITRIAGTGEVSDEGSHDGGDGTAVPLNPVDAQLAPDGGLIVGDRWWGLRYVAPAVPARLGVALGPASASAAQYNVSFTLTRSATVSLAIYRGKTRVTTVGAVAEPGPASLTAARHFPPAPYLRRIDAMTTDGAIWSDKAWAYLGGRLSMRWVKRVIVDAGLDFSAKVGRCHAFGRTHIDCEIRKPSTRRCVHITSMRLKPAGDVLAGQYRCAARKPFKLRPKWLPHSAPEPVQLAELRR